MLNEETAATSQRETEKSKLNSAQYFAIALLPQYEGLADYLAEKDWFNSDAHVFALWQILSNQKAINLGQAILSLKGLHTHQLTYITKGLSLEDVCLLDNPYQLEYLFIYKNANLTAEDLHDKVWFTTELHLKAAKLLIAYHKLSPKAALAELAGLSESLIEKYMLAGMRRENIDGLTELQLNGLYAENGWTALSSWVKASDLRGKTWFDSELHIKALDKLKHQYPELNVQQKIASLENLNAQQLQSIVNGVALEKVMGLANVDAKATLFGNDTMTFFADKTKQTTELPSVDKKFTPKSPSAKH